MNAADTKRTLQKLIGDAACPRTRGGGRAHAQPGPALNSGHDERAAPQAECGRQSVAKSRTAARILRDAAEISTERAGRHQIGTWAEMEVVLAAESGGR